MSRSTSLILTALILYTVYAGMFIIPGIAIYKLARRGRTSSVALVVAALGTLVLLAFTIWLGSRFDWVVLGHGEGCILIPFYFWVVYRLSNAWLEARRRPRNGAA